MKIFIDTSLHIIYEWRDGETTNELVNMSGPYSAYAFQSLVDKILTESQQDKNASGNDIVYALSKKKQKVLAEEMKKLKKQKE